MSPPVDRLLVNAAIEKLIANVDDGGESARIVINFGAQLSTTPRIVTVTKQGGDNDEDVVTGYSPGHGNVTIKDNQKEESRIKTYGGKKERVGYYRLWKPLEGLLVFHHFWKSSDATESGDGYRPDRYYLGYEPVSLNPTFFGISRERVIFRFSFIRTFEFRRPYYEPIFGKMPKFKGINIRVTMR